MSMARAPHRADRDEAGATAAFATSKREALALRYVWWQSAAETLASPDTLLRQILKMGTADDYVDACALWGEQAFKRALASAPAGSLDERSWAFWHRHYGLPERPFPKRSFQ
jgi:hypothetical protein